MQHESMSLSWAWLVLSLFSGKVYCCIHYDKNQTEIKAKGQVCAFILIFVWLLLAAVYQILFRQGLETPQRLQRQLIDIYQRTYHDELIQIFTKKGMSSV